MLNVTFKYVEQHGSGSRNKIYDFPLKHSSLKQSADWSFVETDLVNILEDSDNAERLTSKK